MSELRSPVLKDVRRLALNDLRARFRLSTKQWKLSEEDVLAVMAEAQAEFLEDFVTDEEE